MFVTFSLLLAAVCLLPAAGKLLGNRKMRQSGRPGPKAAHHRPEAEQFRR